MDKLTRQGGVSIRVGDLLPRIRLPSTAGRTVDLAAEVGRNHLVLFFYPGDREGLRYPELVGCTPEACSFRDRLNELRSLGALVFGVSAQPTMRQHDFIRREGLTFELLSDEGWELMESLGIPVWSSPTGERFPVRTTVVVEKGGLVADIFEDVEVEGHVDMVITSLEKRLVRGEGP